MLKIAPGARRVLRDAWNEEGGPPLLLLTCPDMDEEDLRDAVAGVVEDLQRGTGPGARTPSGGRWELEVTWGPSAVPGGVLISFDLLGLEEPDVAGLLDVLARGLDARGVRAGEVRKPRANWKRSCFTQVDGWRGVSLGMNVVGLRTVPTTFDPDQRGPAPSADLVGIGTEWLTSAEVPWRGDPIWVEFGFDGVGVEVVPEALGGLLASSADRRSRAIAHRWTDDGELRAVTVLETHLVIGAKVPPSLDRAERVATDLVRKASSVPLRAAWLTVGGAMVLTRHDHDPARTGRARSDMGDLDEKVHGPSWWQRLGPSHLGLLGGAPVDAIHFDDGTVAFTLGTLRDWLAPWLEDDRAPWEHAVSEGRVQLAPILHHSSRPRVVPP